MFSKTTTLTRLLICLSLSLGVHAGIAFFEWYSSPAQPGAVLNVMEVSLVTAPAAEQKDIVPEARPDQPVNVPVKPTRQPVVKSSPRQQRALEKKTVLQEEPPRAEPVPVEISQAVAQPNLAPVIFPSVDLACKASKAPQEQEPSPDAATTSEMESAASAVPVRQTETVSSAAAAFVAEETDAKPRYRSNPLPKYPYLARQRHWEGLVWLLVTVSTEGRVADLRVAESSGYGVLDRSALKTVRRWRFSPARRAGIPVESQVKVPVKFRLED